MIAKFSSSIKMKLIVGSVLLLTIPLIVLGVLSYQKSGSSLDELGAQKLENSVEMTIEMINVLNSEVEKGNLPLEEAQEDVKVAILGEKDAEGTRPINPNIDLGENGYMFILDSEGNQIAHPFIEGSNSLQSDNPDEVNSTKNLLKEAQAGGGFTYFDWPLPNDDSRIAPKVTYSNQDGHWGWTISAGTYMMDFNKGANEILMFILVVIGVTLVVGIFIIWMFANSISRPLHTVVERMNHLADGDLSLEQIEINSKDETGQLAIAMNLMQENLRGIIANVMEASRVITSESEEMTQSANEVRAGTEQIAMTMEELATGSEAQANHSSDLSEMMGSFVTRVDAANRSGEYVQDSSQGVLDLTNEGSQLMDASMKEMANINNIVEEAVEKVEGLDTHSQEISELVSVIQDIAEQTNLLALNAAIEAARAGEHGQGFAVVADEVRKLAEESATSVTDITDIVDRIQNESSIVSTSLQASYEDVEKGTNQIEATGKTFNEINSSVTEMVKNINSVSENLADIAANSEEMNSSIQEIAAVSEETAAGVEETSASSEQTSSAMEEVAHSSTDLAKLAEELNELVFQFKL